MYKEFFIETEKDNIDLIIARETAIVLYEYMNQDDIKEKINEIHQVNATSLQIQNVILDKCLELGFISEKKGLFSDYETAQLRPDYYKKINNYGMLLEVERGKTIANNMDLLDMWKCHICVNADFLLLVVPIERQTKNGSKTQIYSHVIKRMKTFFMPENYINVKACFIIGY